MNKTTNKKESRTKVKTFKVISLSALSLFFFLFLINPISAQPPFQVFPNLIDGYFIEIPEQGVLKENQDFTFFFHIFNMSNGLPLGNSEVGCEFNLHDSTSKLLYTDNDLQFDSGTTAFFVEITKGNFTPPGDFTYVTHCNSTEFGGVVSVEVIVTPSGRGGTENIFLIILMIVVVYSVTLIGFFKQSPYMTLLGGMFMLFLGIYMVNNGIIIYRDVLTNYFSYFTITIGALTALGSAIFLIEEEM